MIPSQIAPMWGLVIDKKRNRDEHASWWTSQSLNQNQLKLFKQMLRGEACEVF